MLLLFQVLCLTQSVRSLRLPSCLSYYYPHLKNEDSKSQRSLIICTKAQCWYIAQKNDLNSALLRPKPAVFSVQGKESQAIHIAFNLCLGQLLVRGEDFV